MNNERCKVVEPDDKDSVTINICRKCEDKGYYKDLKGEYIACDCWASLY